MHNFLLAPASASAVPMECESVAEVDLSREIEDVIESPVREDMAAAAAAGDRRNTRGGRPRKTLYTAPCAPVAFSSDEDDAVPPRAASGPSNNSGSSGPDHDPDFDPEVTVADPEVATRRRTRAGARTRDGIQSYCIFLASLATTIHIR